MMFQDVDIVIPAYEPYDRLLELLKNIRDKENQMFDMNTCCVLCCIFHLICTVCTIHFNLISLLHLSLLL